MKRPNVNLKLLELEKVADKFNRVVSSNESMTDIDFFLKGRFGRTKYKSLHIFLRDKTWVAWMYGDPRTNMFIIAYVEAILNIEIKEIDARSDKVMDSTPICMF